MYWSVVWCSGGCSWKCRKTLMFCSLLTRSTISCACHAKRHLSLQKWSEPLVFWTFWLQNVLHATTACTFSTSQLPKVVRHWGVLYILTSKCASRHNGVHFFDISTSKSGPKLSFVHFHFEMRFAPQRRALFPHRNFQKRSEAEFCTFSLRNVPRATTACTFSTSQLPKVVRPWCVLYILPSKCASRHNAVQFFITHLASWLCTRRFSEPTFRPSGATNHWTKHSESRLSYLFAHLHLLSSDSFSSDLLSSNLSLLSASALHCFSCVHIVGSLTSKLPSTIMWYQHAESNSSEFSLFVLIALWSHPECCKSFDISHASLITSHHLSSPLITSHHLSSPLITSHHLSSPLITQ